MASEHNVFKLNFTKKLNQKKLSLFKEWLQHGTVMLLFDIRKNGVKIPLEFSNNGILRLNFSYRFYIADFNFNESEVSATLSFDSGDYFCNVPWTAVFGMQSEPLNQLVIWFEDFPSDYDQKSVLGITKEEYLLKESEGLNNNNNILSIDFSLKN